MSAHRPRTSRAVAGYPTYIERKADGVRFHRQEGGSYLNDAGELLPLSVSGDFYVKGRSKDYVQSESTVPAPSVPEEDE